MSGQIEDYALIGDLRTAALVGTDGAIDWLSLPRFDGPAVFAALLGDDGHGRWELAPRQPSRRCRRRRRPRTLILETEWITGEGAVLVSDFMVPGSPVPTVVRIVDGLAGSMTMRTAVSPRMNYGGCVPAVMSTGGSFTARAGGDELVLTCDIPLNAADGSLSGDFVVAAGDRIAFTLSAAGTTYQPIVDASRALRDTEAFWTNWISRSTYDGPWANEVDESLIVLKALTYAPTGAIVAAATTSLPERIGGSRNWDYRYCWLRDAAFTLDAFLAAGFVDEAEAWRDWLLQSALQSVLNDRSEPQLMYAVDGGEDLTERVVDWLPGHRESRPVRIGNGAAVQRQNDVWGEVLDVLWTARTHGLAPAAGEEKLIRSLLDVIEQHWREPDHGLWEVRGPQRHFTHSKLLSWVGVDRAARLLATQGALDSHERARLSRLRATMAQDISTAGYHPGLGAFTQSYGSSRLDAAVLLMPRYGFLTHHDPRLRRTAEAIQRELTDDGLVLRYAVGDAGCNVDGIHGGEGAFLPASFWLCDALSTAGRADEATDLFERLLSLRNDVGLLSEEYDVASGRHLGNTPQALSHAGLITTAVTLGVRQSATDPRTAVA